MFCHTRTDLSFYYGADVDPKGNLSQGIFYWGSKIHSWGETKGEKKASFGVNASYICFKHNVVNHTGPFKRTFGFGLLLKPLFFSVSAHASSGCDFLVQLPVMIFSSCLFPHWRIWGLIEPRSRALCQECWRIATSTGTQVLLPRRQEGIGPFWKRKNRTQTLEWLNGRQKKWKTLFFYWTTKGPN